MPRTPCVRGNCEAMRRLAQRILRRRTRAENWACDNYHGYAITDDNLTLLALVSVTNKLITFLIKVESMSKLGYTRQAAAIPCHCSNTAKTRYDKENYSNGNKTVYEPAKGTQY